MNLFFAIFLGIIQGLTEFLPVSSSGHLVLFQKLIPGFSQPGILFDVILHFGTLAAVLYFFRKVIVSLSQKYIIFLIVGTIPAVVAGLIFREQFELMFLQANYLGLEFIITGIINIIVDYPQKKKSELKMNNSFWVGVAQAIAIIPGISRSGATIFAAVRQGIDRKKAAEFSFILSVPAILGANILELKSHGFESVGNLLPIYFIGFLAAFITGFLSIGIVIKLLERSKFKYFGYYCLVLGLLVIFFF